MSSIIKTTKMTTHLFKNFMTFSFSFSGRSAKVGVGDEVCFLEDFIEFIIDIVNDIYIIKK